MPADRSEVKPDYMDLGSLKGNIGSQNYPIPAETDIVPFKSVVIYCMPFHVVFSTATLN
ncbi:MAG: DM13 domain-containing protein [Candidatus Tectomicrobia bacterium]|nr:DM13 domain-containing protein [Candidatus Tectomicrobia bacterium]